MAIQVQLGLDVVTARSEHAEVAFSEPEIRQMIKRLTVDMIGNLKSNLAGSITDDEMHQREVQLQTIRHKLARLVGDLP